MRRGRAWGNALGGWRSQPRGKGGKFARKGSGVSAVKRKAKATRKTARRSANAQHRSTVKRNNKSYRNRTKGSGKARVREVVKFQDPGMAAPYIVGAAAVGYGAAQKRSATMGNKSVNKQYSRYTSGSSYMSVGAGLIGAGVAASAKKSRQSNTMFRGLRRSQNSYSRYNRRVTKKQANLAYRNTIRAYKGKAPKAGKTYLTATQWRARRDKRQNVYRTGSRVISGATGLLI